MAMAATPTSASAAAAAAAAPVSLGKLGVIRLDAEYKHDGRMGIAEWFAENAAGALGRSDFTQPIKVSQQSNKQKTEETQAKQKQRETRRTQ